MEVNFAPELQSKLNKLAAQSGRTVEELVQEVVAGYVGELAGLHSMLESRYVDVKSGRVQPMDGEDSFRKLREMSAEKQRGA